METNFFQIQMKAAANTPKFDLSGLWRSEMGQFLNLFDEQEIFIENKTDVQSLA